MKKKRKKIIIPDFDEFTDGEGKKWVQTSVDDLFSTQELNNILTSIEKDKNSEDIVLARIDFQRVNKEYYEKAVSLQTKLKKQTELLKSVIEDSKIKIERKNSKLKELIEYIKKIHKFIAYINSKPEDLDKIKIAPDLFVQTQANSEKIPDDESEPSVYEEVEELVLSLDDLNE